MLHLFATFTIRNTTKATIMKVNEAAKKSPTPNQCFVNEVVRLDRFDKPGTAKPMKRHNKVCYESFH